MFINIMEQKKLIRNMIQKSLENSIVVIKITAFSWIVLTM